MDEAITLVRTWIITHKTRDTFDGSAPYDALDQEFSEAMLAILVKSEDEDEAVEAIDTLFTSSWDYKQSRYIDLFLDVRNTVRPVTVEVEEEECQELIGISQ